MIIESARHGLCSVVLPNHLYSYDGNVLVHTYIKFEDGRSLDAGLIVTEFKKSWLDNQLPEMDKFYVKRFEDLARDIQARADELEELLNDERFQGPQGPPGLQGEKGDSAKLEDTGWVDVSGGHPQVESHVQGRRVGNVVTLSGTFIVHTNAQRPVWGLIDPPLQIPSCLKPPSRGLLNFGSVHIFERAVGGRSGPGVYNLAISPGGRTQVRDLNFLGGGPAGMPMAGVFNVHLTYMSSDESEAVGNPYGYGYYYGDGDHWFIGDLDDD